MDVLNKNLNEWCIYYTMGSLLSPTDCFFCKMDTNIHKFRFPCECSIYSHPDCYTQYVFTSWNNSRSRPVVKCVKCHQTSPTRDHVAIQINIPPETDDDTRVITRKDLKREKCIMALVMTVQGVLITTLVGVVLWMYIKLIMGVFP